MVDCLGKPFTAHELWNCLTKYLIPVSLDEEDPTEMEQADEELLNKLICNFVRNNRDKFAEITAVLDSGDIKLAHRLVHTLKGNAAQLGKPSLQKAAQEVESRLRDGENNTTVPQMEALKTELETVLAELEPIAAKLGQQEKQQEEQPAKQLSPAEITQLLEALIPLLEEGNPECLNYTAQLRQIPEGAKWTRQMEDFNFSTALDMIMQWKEGGSI